MRLDESNWTTIHQGTHRKNDPYERIPIALNFPSDRLIVSINLLDLTKSWVRAGWLIQFWPRGMAQVLIVRRFLTLNQETVVQIEPLAYSNLFIETFEYIEEFGLIVEARQ